MMLVSFSAHVDREKPPRVDRRRWVRVMDMKLGKSSTEGEMKNANAGKDVSCL